MRINATMMERAKHLEGLRQHTIPTEFGKLLNDLPSCRPSVDAILRRFRKISRTVPCAAARDVLFSVFMDEDDDTSAYFT